MSSEEETELTSPVSGDLTATVDCPDTLDELNTEPSSEVVHSSSTVSEPSTSHRLAVKLKQFLTCQEKDDRGPGLRKELTLINGVALVTGNIIGSGIFITPRKIFENTGSFGLTMVVWVLGALIALVGGLCYVELGVVLRKSGGELLIFKTAYSFNNRNSILGKVMAFLYAWSSVLVIRGLSIAIITLTCASYLTRPFYINCEAPQSVRTLLALSILILITLVNSLNIKLFARVMTVLSSLKIIALLIIALVGVVYIITHNGLPSDTHHPFAPYTDHTPSVGSVAIGLYGVIFAYDGWSSTIYATEEMKNIDKTLPCSLFIGVPLVAVCYLLVNLAYFGVLCYNQILESDTIALTFAYETLGEAGLVIIPLMVSLSTFGAALAAMYSSARVIFVAGRDGLFPQAFSGLHKKQRSPIVAVLFMVCVVFVGVLIGDVSFLLDGFSAVAMLFYGCSFAAVLILRVTHKEAPRPFKAWFIIPVSVFALLVSAFLVILPLIQEPLPCLAAFAVVISGLLLYPLLFASSPWRKYLTRMNNWFTRIAMNLFNIEIATEL